MKFVEEFKKVQGTKWDVALTVAHHMDPPPDVIFFMADGTGGNEPDPIIEVNKLKGRPVINTIAMQTCLLYTSPSPRDQRGSRMPSSA